MVLISDLFSNKYQLIVSYVRTVVVKVLLPAGKVVGARVVSFSC